MLLFKKIYYDAIADGRKTTTLRFWKYARVRPGSEHTVPRLGRLRIEAVGVVDPGDLTEQHARDDGFTSLSELRMALEDMYGDDPAAEGRKLYLVRFRYLGPSQKS